MSSFSLLEVLTDTTTEAVAMQVATLRRLGPEGRAALGARMSEDARRISMDAVRHRHPEYSEPQVRRTMFGPLLGEAVAERIWPDPAGG